MVPTQTLETYPPFGDNSTKVQPDNAKYAAGFQPADVYPAEWVNWAWGKNTRCITDLNAGVNMMEKEINNVLDGAGKTPDATKENQLLQSIQKLISDAETRAKLAAHPVGSLYWSSDSTDPGTLFGGTWQRIKDKFILAAGDTYTNGATGGAATVTLTTSNMPSHSHTIGGNTGETQPTFTGTAVTSGAGSAHSHGLNSHTHSLNSHVHNMEHKHTTGAMSANSTGSATGLYIYRDSGDTPTITGSALSLTTSGTQWSGTSKKDGGYLTGISINVAHTHTTNSMTNSSGVAITLTGAATGNTGVASGNTTNESAHTHSVTASGTVQKHSHTLPANTGSNGSGTAVDKMPPYLVKYCWERVS